MFLADSPSLFQKPDEPLVAPPLALDPIVLLSALASATTHLGLIGTVSTSFEEPYNVARRFASLDHLSGGRVAWNVVTSSDPYAWNNFGGGGQPDRRERYRRSSMWFGRCGIRGMTTRCWRTRRRVRSAGWGRSARSTITASSSVWTGR
ncbi:hypothetical protein MLIT_33320 [Mycolicibacterium litorale]|uniref:Luciferase-like domain-containing protein n=1 Tax=Mycolicibacterium litorale TaxID=758802 RepID=A0AAD1IL58_9MYCO|nr:hypothetical protein MLIT_33320 [Mycolicibacterium litorale]